MASVAAKNPGKGGKNCLSEAAFSVKRTGGNEAAWAKATRCSGVAWRLFACCVLG